MCKRVIEYVGIWLFSAQLLPRSRQEETEMNTVTCVAPVNIAVVKYWGKRDEALMLPANDNISVTFDTRQLCAKTTVMASSNFTEDCIWLNGQKEDIRNPRLQNCLAEIRKRASNCNELKNYKVHICSENNFPTAAGLASSAAGYACLVTALAELYKIQGDVSSIARLGSGSACRSTMGGFVKWSMGTAPNGEDSIASQIAPASHWPEMRALILVVQDARKHTPSAIGMKRCIETSSLIQHRIKHTVPDRIIKMQRAISENDFKTFAEQTMKDSNQMHAVCLDAYPPCTYMNDISFAVTNLVHSYNEAIGDIKVAYTFDAGPNPTLFILKEDVANFMGLIDHFFPPLQNSSTEYKRGLPLEAIKPSQDLLDKINITNYSPGCFKFIIYTQVGDGPTFLENPKHHLLNEKGLPVKQV